MVECGMPRLLALLEGLSLGASLIIAIGAQNAFVLRQGLRRHHVFLSAAFCAGADLVLIGAGVFGLGALVRGQTWFLGLMTWGGAGFLAWYGTKAAVRALRPSTMDTTVADAPSVQAVLGSLAAFTFLNPDVIGTRYYNSLNEHHLHLRSPKHRGANFT